MPAVTEGFVSARAQTRKLWLTVHRWLGLGALLVMLALGVTGSLLVWPEYFDSLANPARYPEISTAEFKLDDAFLATARRELGSNDAISGIAIPLSEGAIMVGGQVNGPPPLGLGPPSRKRIWFDPLNRRPLARTSRGDSFTFWLHAIHGHLLLRDFGREAVALAGLLLLISAGSGLYLMWPGRRRIAQMLKWHKSNGFWMNAHRQTGIWLGLILIVEGITGAWIALPRLPAALIEPGTATVRSGPEGPPLARSLSNPNLAIGEVLALANATIDSEAPTTRILFPTLSDPLWRLTLQTVNGPVEIRIDDNNRAAKVVLPQPTGPADQAERLVTSIHIGNFGLLWEIAVFLSGIALALLSLSGIWLWFIGRKSRRRRRKTVASST